MSTLNPQNIRTELCHFLRNSDIISTTIRGVTTTSDNFVISAPTSQLTLTKSGVRNIRSVSIGGSAFWYYLFDYTVNWTTGVLTFTTPFTGGTVNVNYDYGTSDKIFPDMPRDDLTLNSYPRVSIEFTSMNSQPLGLGATNDINNILITIYAWVPANKETSIAGGNGGQDYITTILYNIRNSIRNNKKGFYYFKYIEPHNISPIIKGTSDKLLQQSQDYYIKFLVE